MVRSVNLFSNPLAILLLALLGLILPLSTSAYQVLISDQDDVRQVCTGMWGKGKQDAFIEVLFSPSSRGQLALVIFEWQDAKYLGVNPNAENTENHWSDERVYICTLSALSENLCTEADLGRFITTPATLPESSSIFTTSVRFDPVPSAPQNPQEAEASAGPFRYAVTKTGYYCVGTVPVTLEGDVAGDGESASAFVGVVDFMNVFEGHLSSGDYPKVAFYFSLGVVYLALAAGWGFLCWQNRGEILAIQHYISGTLAFLVVEMFVVYSYWNYLNTTGHPGVARTLLVLVAVLNAARNSLSFFMLLITAMGYGVVRPSLGPIMTKVRLLAGVHFVFGVLYALGTVSIPLETAGFFIFFFVFPLAFSLTGFLMWIMWSLNATIADLGARKQSFKKSMFTKLYRILVIAVVVIGAFFVISSLSFSSRLDEDFAPGTWKSRWILLDGWLGVLYLVVFSSVAWLWRPTANNRRLALSDELPTDETEADQFDVDALAREDSDKDNVPMRGLGNDSVVFDVGDDDEEDEERGIGMERKGENRPLKLEESDDEDARPPSSNKRAD